MRCAGLGGRGGGDELHAVSAAMASHWQYRCGTGSIAVALAVSLSRCMNKRGR